MTPVNAETQNNGGICPGQRQDLGHSAVNGLLPASLRSWAVVDMAHDIARVTTAGTRNNPCKVPWSFPLGVSCAIISLSSPLLQVRGQFLGPILVQDSPRKSSPTPKQPLVTRTAWTLSL